MPKMIPEFHRSKANGFEEVAHMREDIAASLYQKLKEFLRVTPGNVLKWQPREDSQSKPSFEEFIKYYNIKLT